MATNWTSTKIDTTNPAFKYNATTVNAKDPNAQMTAATWTPTKDALVEDRMTGLMSKDSDYRKLAETSGLQYANSRGLLNSTMGAEAGYSAGLKSMLPIASQDAQTVTTSGLTNQAAENNARQFNASTFNQRDLSNAGFVNDAGKFNSGNQVQLSMSNNAMENDAGKFNASEANTTERLGTELASREKVSANQLAGQMAQSSAQIASSERMANAQIQSANIGALAAKEASMLTSAGSMMGGAMENHNSYVRSISSDPDLTPEAKQALIYNSEYGTRNAINLTGSVFAIPELDNILGTFGNAPEAAPIQTTDQRRTIDPVTRRPNADPRSAIDRVTRPYF
jgi:hypothetical protein